MEHECSPFCDLPVPTSTAPDDAHGAWCVSQPVGREILANTDTGPTEITIDRVQSWPTHDERSLIRLDLEPLAHPVLHSAARLTSGAARQLAATLIHAADLTDELTSGDA
jgi:hypothetical protein